jgi:hypothetical protein
VRTVNTEGQKTLCYIVRVASTVDLSKVFLKGTGSRDFLLLVFFMIQFPPTPEFLIGLILNFLKIRRDIRKSRCTTEINDSLTCAVDTGGKFATGVNDTGGKFVVGVNDTGANNGNNIRLEIS